MAKKIAPPNSGKHDVQSYLREGEDENTKYFNVEGKEFKDSHGTIVSGAKGAKLFAENKKPPVRTWADVGNNKKRAEKPNRSAIKSDFDNLLSAINLNIMNSYTKFRNKKDLDFSAFDKKPDKKEHPSGKKTKLDKEDIPKPKISAPKSEALGSREGQFSYQIGGKKQRLAGDTRIYGGRRTEHAKPTEVTETYTEPKGIHLPHTTTTTQNLAHEEDKPKKESAPKVKNPYRQDEKGKYVRGTGYEKPVTGSRTTPHKQRRNVAGDESKQGIAYEALPSTRTRDRHEGKDQKKIGAGKDSKSAGKKQRVHGEDRGLGIETQDPLSPHKHLRQQDPKTGEVIRDRFATNPRNVKWLKGGRKKEPKEAERAVRQGMQNLKGMGISYKGSRMGIKLKGERHSSRGRGGSKTAPLGGEERGRDWWKFWKENTEKSLNALLIKIEDIGWQGSGARPANETFGDERFRGNPAGIVHKKPKNEEQHAENVAGKELANRQWDKEDFKMNYSSPDERATREAKEWQKKKMALLKAFLSPITFKYKEGHTYERGQTKNVETQAHSRTGNTNNDQTYKQEKDDLTIKSLDEIFNEWKSNVSKKW